MIIDPREIEKKSFEIIRRELKTPVDPDYEPVIVRMIHTSADFEYATITHFVHDALENGIRALKNGSSIYADTSMICAGVSRRLLKQLGCDIFTFVHDPDVAKAAREKGITRSMVAVEKACTHKNIQIFAIGNAPTALGALLHQIQQKVISPALVIGVPVGFVGAAEAKKALSKAGVPAIITRGRKGGSPIAAAILNALLRKAVL